MRLLTTYLFVGILVFTLFGQCQTKSSFNKSATINTIGNLRIDTTIRLLKSGGTLPLDNIRELKVIDSFYTYGSNGDVFYDTTVQLTNNIFYSIISLSDTFGLCSYYFVLTIDEKNKKAIKSNYLHSACDIDFSADNYDLYNHKIISNNRIKIQQTTVYQKKDRTSNDEEQNIERKEVKDLFIIIKETGEIVSNEK